MAKNIKLSKEFEDKLKADYIKSAEEDGVRISKCPECQEVRFHVGEVSTTLKDDTIVTFCNCHVKVKRRKIIFTTASACFATFLFSFIFSILTAEQQELYHIAMISFATIIIICAILLIILDWRKIRYAFNYRR